MADEAKARLLSILQQREIPLGLDDIQWAFDSDATRQNLQAWIEEYLQESTLLTKDELDLFNGLGETVKLDLAGASRNVVPLQDRELREAIAALKSSTSVIEGHAKALEEQRRVLEQFKEVGNADSKPDGLGHAYAQERSSLAFAIEDLTFSINDQLGRAETETRKALGSVTAFTTDRLAADDELLEALSKLHGAEGTAGPSATHEQIEQWLQTLAGLRVAEVKLRLDTKMVSAFPADQASQSEEHENLVAELQTLRDEIDSVVIMVLGKQLRTPLLKHLESAGDAASKRKLRWNQYRLVTLEYLVLQLNAASERVAALHDHADALREIRGLVKDTSMEAVGPLDAARPPAKRPTLTEAPRSLSGQSQPLPPAQQVLRRFNIKTSETTPTEQLLQLEHSCADSIQRLRSQYAATEQAMLLNLCGSLAPRQREALALLRQLYANSTHRTVALADVPTERRLTELERKINEMAPKVSAGDALRI